MTRRPAGPSAGPARPRLQREWVVFATAAAGARFIPVPVVDELVREHALRTAIRRTWRAHGRPECPAAIDALVDAPSGAVREVMRATVWLPVKLLLYPLRKLVRYVTAVRGVTRDLAEVLLLARSLDRCLSAGWLVGTDSGQLREQARMIRRAHEQTVRTADLRVLTQAIRVSWRSVPGLWPPTRRSADPRAEAEGARVVSAALQRPEVAQLLTELDARFDAALRTTAGRGH